MSLNLSTASREELVCAYNQMAQANQTLHQTIENLRHTLEETRKSFDQEKILLTARINWFERQLFGTKSERFVPQDSQQIALFELPKHAPPDTVSINGYNRATRKHMGDLDEDEKARFSENVPVDEVVIFPKEIAELPDDSWEVIGEKVTERLVYVPVQYRVKRTIRKTVKLKGSLLTAPAPAAIIERSMADGTLLAGLITDKFQYHLPLYRQHQRMEKSGVNISRGHLTKLVHRTLEILEPVYNAILSSIVANEVVAMDETPIRVGRKKKGVMKTAWFWPVVAEHQVAFIYANTRSAQVVTQTLGEYCRKLITDGHAAYGSYTKHRPDLIHAQCWAHARRYFFEAKEHSPPECERVLQLIKKLFETEAKIARRKSEVEKLEAGEIISLRQEESLPVINELFSFLDDLWFCRMLDGRSLLGKAVQYARNAEKGLKAFLTHPDIPLSNNEAERSIRPVTIGRKNWLFCWSEIGAKYAAIAYTLIESCKMQKIDPWTYLVDLLQRIDSHPARDIALLTPKIWKDHFKQVM